MKMTERGNSDAAVCLGCHHKKLGTFKVKAPMCASDDDIGESAKVGLDALFLLLVHFFCLSFFLRWTLVNIFCITKSLYSFTWRASFVTFSKKKRKTKTKKTSQWGPRTWNVSFCCLLMIQEYKNLLFAEN